jgi:2-hydroxychromene-2-carboxylate isomerase
MSTTIDYYFSLVSPWTYLGGARLAEIARKHKAEVRVRPVELGVIFPQTGGLPLGKRAPARQAYRLVELERWREVLDMPLNLHPAFFPAPEKLAARLVIAAERCGADPLALSQAILRGVWAEERNIADASELKAIADAAGCHADTLMAEAIKPEIEEIYARNTQEALAAGVFGSPSYVVDGELFWGQDRLDLLERKLARG